MSEAAFPRGPQRPAASDMARLARRLSDLERLLHAHMRAAPLAVSGVHMYPNRMQVESTLNVTGTTTLGTSTSIAGVGMNTFITTTQATTAEVDASHSGHPNLKSKIDAINAKAEDALSDASAAQSAASGAQSTASAVQSEVITARSSSGSLGARINAHKAALNNIIGVVNDIFDRLDDIDNKGLAPGTWPPPIPM